MMKEDITVHTTKLSERGQLVIPRDVRQRLSLVAGSRFLVVSSGDAIVLQRVDLTGESARARDLLGRAKILVGKLGLRR
jgi:AbrB family looped-hinge helix DNA binding protein